MPDPLVIVDGVSRDFPQGRYGARTVLDAVSCRVEAGERVAVTGPSGSGKSTLLNLMGGLDAPSRGVVCWPGLSDRGDGGMTSGNDEIARRRRIAYVFQAANLLPALTVAENVGLPLMLAADDADRDDRVRSLLEAFELAAFADKLPAELSGGQAQRVGVARALISRPRLLLADEPTGQLDHPTAQRVLDVVLALLADYGGALVVATHDSAVAARLDRRSRLNHGRLVTTTEDATCS